jgi:uncharacterized membrane protein
MFVVENWIILTLLSAGIGSIGSIYDRYIVKNELKNTDTLLVLWGFFTGIMFCGPAIITNEISFSALTLALGIISGALYIAAMHYYYKAINEGEVSRVVPILSMNPVLVLILATIFLGEIHTPIKYLGIAFILIGVIVHTIDREHHKLISKKIIFWGVLSASLFAIKNIVAKIMSLAEMTPLNVLFWIGLCIFIINIPITIILWKKLKIKHKRDLPEIATVATIAGAATLIYTAAIVIGPVSLVTFLDRISILFVFIISEIIDFFNPKLLHEKFSTSAFYQKLIGVIIVLVGSYLLI